MKTAVATGSAQEVVNRFKISLYLTFQLWNKLLIV